MANFERRLVDNFWDLRDDAYDHPARWEGVTAEAIFQRLLMLEAAEQRGEIDWWTGRDGAYVGVASKRGTPNCARPLKSAYADAASSARLCR
ncbi:hypothetical protein [Nocardioides sp.]|uniref:hypothetical protein n=1 Tax=Nocardioides sp. TaxID=35761 RepID=UPI0035277930